MKKLGEGNFSGLALRYFRFNDGKLYYYKSHEEKKEINFIQVTDSSIYPFPHDGKKPSSISQPHNHIFVINTPAREYILVARDEEEMKLWVRELRKRVEVEVNSNLSLADIGNPPTSYKIEKNQLIFHPIETEYSVEIDYRDDDIRVVRTFKSLESQEEQNKKRNASILALVEQTNQPNLTDSQQELPLGDGQKQEKQEETKQIGEEEKQEATTEDNETITPATETKTEIEAENKETSPNPIDDPNSSLSQIKPTISSPKKRIVSAPVGQISLTESGPTIQIGSIEYTKINQPEELEGILSLPGFPRLENELNLYLNGYLLSFKDEKWTFVGSTDIGKEYTLLVKHFFRHHHPYHHLLSLVL